MDKIFIMNSLQQDSPPRIYWPIPVTTNRQEKVLSNYWKIKIITR